MAGRWAVRVVECSSYVIPRLNQYFAANTREEETSKMDIMVNLHVINLNDH